MVEVLWQEPRRKYAKRKVTRSIIITNRVGAVLFTLLMHNAFVAGKVLAT